MVRDGVEMVIDGVGLNNLQATGSRLLNLSNGCRIWLLEGDLGAGKTTLIKEICAQLGVEENVSSPTFSIINESISSLR